MAPAVAMVVLAMPVLTIVIAGMTGTLTDPEHGWAGVSLTYLVFLALMLLTASFWEETAWSGFVQRRLINRQGSSRARS